MNYYVDLAGRGRVPMNKKGFIAIDHVSQIIRTDSKLQIINPGFTWQLSAATVIVAERWERILRAAITEIGAINKRAAAAAAGTAASSLDAADAGSDELRARRGLDDCSRTRRRAAPGGARQSTGGCSGGAS